METVHIVSECNTADLFCLFLLMFNTGACPTSTAVLTVGHFLCVASCDSLTDSDLQLFIETEQDRTRHTFIQ